MAKIFGTFIFGYDNHTRCSCCQRAITKENALVLQNEIGSYHAMGLCCDEADGGGYEWRCFCRPCFEKLSHQDPEAVFAQYPASCVEDDED